MKKEKNKSKTHMLRNVVVIILFLITLVILFQIAPNYERKDAYVQNKINLIINHNNVTRKLKHDLWMNEKKVIYMSKEDITNYFDQYLYLDKDNNQIITTYGEKIGVLSLEKNIIYINDTKIDVLSGAIQKDGIYYLPITSMGKIYNVNIEYVASEQILLLDSLDRKFIKADISKNCNIKYKTTTFSKTVDKVKKGEKVVCIENLNNQWSKVRTSKGYIGYVKTNLLQNMLEVRSDIPKTERSQTVNLVWDYFSEYKTAPDRKGTTIQGINVVAPTFFSLVSKGNGKIKANVGNQGIDYIKWAQNNHYEVWGMFSNNSYKETTSEILHSYELRTKVINQIVSFAIQYNLNGINLDFENMNIEDKEMFSRFVIELKPKLQEAGIVLSVDVTTLDGGGAWSECYDRHVIGGVADYIILMAYDQYSINSKNPGTTAGYNWVKTNLTKMINREEIPSNKIILGIPLYTRLWAIENETVVVNKTIDMKDIAKTIPSDVHKEWNDELKQYYVSYIKEGKNYQMWIEDDKSIEAKVSLVKQYHLAGVASWEKDRETENIWNVIEQALHK